MSSLKFNEKQILEGIFDRGGYVLDFSDRTFSAFFKEFTINIDDSKYKTNGTSKMNRLRSFWELESDPIVGKVLKSLLEYASNIKDFNSNNANKAHFIINRLLGKIVEEEDISVKYDQEEGFINKEFSNIDLTMLKLDHEYEKVIIQRIDEIKKTFKSEAALSVIFLCGSTLEGLLLDVASKNSQTFNLSNSAPKDKEGKIRPLYEWSLENLINTAQEVGYISLDVKKYCYGLKDFRNYIHPRQQASQGFNPDMHTAKISWQVLLAALADLTGERKY